MYIYIYVYMYICYLYICIYVYMYIWLYLHIYIYMYVCLCMYVCMYTVRARHMEARTGFFFGPANWSHLGPPTFLDAPCVYFRGRRSIWSTSHVIFVGRGKEFEGPCCELLNRNVGIQPYARFSWQAQYKSQNRNVGRAHKKEYIFLFFSISTLWFSLFCETVAKMHRNVGFQRLNLVSV